MRRVLAAAVLVAFMPTANAQDKGKADFSSNAEFRARFFYMQNPGGNENTKSSARMGESRFKLGANYKANEKVSAHLSVLHNATFGQGVNGDAVIDTQSDNKAGTATQSDNAVTVNEAYGLWRSSEDLAFKVGRFNWQIADGALVGTNDWEAVPYSFEGLASVWEQEFGTLTFAAVKLRELTGTSASGDPEHNLYGINFDLKSKPEMLKMLNVHVLKNNSDAIDSASAVDGKMATSKDGFDTMRYGTMAGLVFGPVDLNLWYEMQGGKVKNINGGTKTEYDYKGNMMQAQVAFNMPTMMSSRFHLTYHKDSGDSDAADKELGTYDSYATEKHNSAGAMDLFAWGNLTFIQLGWTAKPQDKTDVGVQFTMFSLTENNATGGTPGWTGGTYGGDLNGATQKNDADKLGNEIDLWATHHYDANLSNTLRLGYFMPGDRFDTTTAPSTDKILHVMLEGKATF